MKFSEQWLRTWVNPNVSRDELVARLSMTGLEVDSVTPAAGVFSGVVVGEIVSAEQHPDADKLRVCQVSNGSEQFQVVCGAPNARPGIRFPLPWSAPSWVKTSRSRKPSCAVWNPSASSVPPS